MEGMNDIMRSLGRLEGKQDAILANQAEHSRKIKEQGERLDKVEKRQVWWAGAIAALSFFVANAMSVLKHLG